MTSENDTRSRVLSVWGSDAYGWSGEERQRAAGFPLDPSGRQRVLGFPADSSWPVGRKWLRSLAHPVRPHRRRVPASR